MEEGGGLKTIGLFGITTFFIYLFLFFSGLDREPMRGAGVYFVLRCVDFFYLPDSAPCFEIVWVCFFSY